MSEVWRDELVGSSIRLIPDVGSGIYFDLNTIDIIIYDSHL